jgi:hypothetical protein
MNRSVSDEKGNSESGQVPKIEFPCLYPIKVIGVSVPGFHESVLKAVERHTGGISDELVKSKPSKNENYVSIQITIAAVSVVQLESIFIDLKKIEQVKMVL